MSLGRNSVAYVLANLFNQFIQILTIPLLTRLADPSDFGVYSIFAGVCGIVGVFSGLRYDGAISVAKNDRQAGLAFGLFSILGFLTSLLVIISGVGLSLFIPVLGGVSTFVLSLLAGIFVGFSTLSRAYIAWHTRQGDFVRIGVIQFMIASGSVLLQILFLLVETSPVIAMCFGLVAGQILSVIVGGLGVANCNASRRSFPTLQWAAIARKFSNFPRFAMLYGVNTNVRERIITPLVGWGAGPIAAGSFAMGQRLASMPHTLLYTSIGGPLLNYARTNTRQDVAKVSCMLMQMSFAILLPPFLFGIINAKTLIATTLGPKWAGIAPYFSGLALTYVLIASTGFMDRLYELYGQQRASLRLDFGFSIAVFLCLVPMCFLGSGIGIMVAFAIAYSLYEIYWTYMTFVINKLPTVHLRGVVVFAVLTGLSFFLMNQIISFSISSLATRAGVFLGFYFVFLSAYWFILGGREQMRILFHRDTNRIETAI